MGGLFSDSHARSTRLRLGLEARDRDRARTSPSVAFSIILS